MAKRFVDTSLFKRDWFQELPLVYKLFWYYICNECDNAGFWNVNLKMASYILNGVELDGDQILKVFNGKIIKTDDDKWFIPKFIYFQQNGKELNHNNMAHRQIIKLLEREGMLDDEGAWKGPQSPLKGASKGLRYSIVYISINKKEKTTKKENNIKERKSGRMVYREEGHADGKW